MDRRPAILGTERTGPDLSQEGGEHPDDWHVAHFTNPRYTSPISLMPSWEFLGPDRIAKLTAYVQAEGRKDADYRVGRQSHWKSEAHGGLSGRGGPERRTGCTGMSRRSGGTCPIPIRPPRRRICAASKIYQEFCIGCHGPMGDGEGPAAPYLDPPPLNFTTLRRHLVQGKYIGGIFYYQIMNGITGTAMPYFKRMLESEKIWDVSNYVGRDLRRLHRRRNRAEGDRGRPTRTGGSTRTRRREKLGEQPAQRPGPTGPNP